VRKRERDEDDGVQTTDPVVIASGDSDKRVTKRSPSDEAQAQSYDNEVSQTMLYVMIIR
jgi:hypothetical protein